MLFSSVVDDKHYEANVNGKTLYLFYNIISVTFVYKLLDFFFLAFFYRMSDT